MKEGEGMRMDVDCESVYLCAGRKRREEKECGGRKQRRDRRGEEVC